MNKKLLFLLAFIASMLSAPALVSADEAPVMPAATPYGGDEMLQAEESEPTYVAQIGETKYESIVEALNAVQDGETITMLQQTIVPTTPIYWAPQNGATINIDLGDYYLARTATSSYIYLDASLTSLTINVVANASNYLRFVGGALMPQNNYYKITSTKLSDTSYQFTYTAKDVAVLFDGVPYENFDMTTQANYLATGGTAKFMKDITISSVYKPCTLDLNGHTISAGKLSITKDIEIIDSSSSPATVNDDYSVDYSGGVLNFTGTGLSVQGSGSVTLKSGKICGNVRIEGSGDASFTIEGGLIEASTDVIAVFTGRSQQTLNVNGGVVKATSAKAITGNGEYHDVEININGGTIIGPHCGIYHPQDGRLNITGGRIISTEGVGILMRAGQLEMSGGEIVALGTQANLEIGDADHANTPSGVLVFDADANYPGLAENAPSIHVTGGTWLAKNFNVFTLQNNDGHFAGTINFDDGVYSDNQISETYLLPNHWMIPNDGEPMFDGHDTYTPGMLIYDDSEDFPRRNTIAAIPDGKTITYKRAFSADQKEKYQSWFTPWNHTLSAADLAQADFYSIQGMEYQPEGTAYKKVQINISKLSEGDLLQALTPYLLLPKSNAEITFVSTSDNLLTLHGRGTDVNTDTGLNLIVDGMDYPFRGTYTTLQANQPLEWLAMSGGEICWNETTAARLGAYRWYILPPAGAPSPAELQFVISNGNTTAIASIDNEATNGNASANVYTLDGRKVNTTNLAKGIYIKGGKKFIVK